MQNPYFGSKIKIPKNMSKSILQIIYSCFVQKNYSKKHQMFEKWEHFENRQSCKAYTHANPHFRSKIKIPKNASKYILQII